MVVVRGVLVPSSGIWGTVYRYARGRGGRGLPALELRGAMDRGGPWVLTEMAGQPGPRGIH